MRQLDQPVNVTPAADWAATVIGSEGSGCNHNPDSSAASDTIYAAAAQGNCMLLLTMKLSPDGKVCCCCGEAHKEGAH